MNAHRGGAPDKALEAEQQHSDRRLIIPPRSDRDARDFSHILATALEQIPLAVSIYDAELRYRFVNKELVKRLGLMSEALIGRRDEDVLPADVTEKYLRTLRACRETRTAQAVEFVLSREEPGLPARFVTLSVRYTPILDQLGAVSAIAATLNDVSEREQQARASEQLAALSRSFGYAIFNVALDGTILSWNGGAERLYGYRAEQIVGSSVAQLMPDSDHSTLQKILRRIAAGEVVDGIETVHVRKSGEHIHVVGTLSPTFAAAGAPSGAQCILHDISKTKALAERLSRSSRLENVGRLTDSVVHELNNILTVIKSYTTFIGDDPSSPSVKSDADIVQKAAQRGSELLAQLLTFSRKQVGAPQALDLNNVVHQFGAVLRHAIADRFKVDVELSEKPLIVFADQAELEQVLLSIVFYARDTMPEDGTLSIRTGSESARPDSDSGVSQATLVVQCTGPGLTPDTVKRLFDPAFIAKDGATSDLATAKALVDKAGGEIHVASELGVGVSFAIKLRALGAIQDAKSNATTSGEFVKLPTLEPIASEAPSEPVRGGGGSNVLALIVDDQDEVRESLQRLLAECDIATVAAKSGLHAMQRLRDLPIDIVIADHFMPGMDGIRLLESIRSLYPDVVRVLYTGHASSEIVTAAINRGGVHKVLPKTMHPIAVRDYVHGIAGEVLAKRAQA